MSRFTALMDGDDAVDGSVDSPAASEKPPPLEDPIFWVDLEMSGLDPSTHTILEVAVIASDGRLSTLVEGPSLVIHHDDDVLNAMNDWSREQHAASGLTERCRASTVEMAEAEEAMCAFVSEHSDGRPAVLGGACVYKDKQFLDTYMPMLRGLLSHRVVDVATVRELARRWQPSAARNAPKGETKHRALDDIRYSIEECRFYRDACWRPMERRRGHRHGRRHTGPKVKAASDASAVKSDIDEMLRKMVAADLEAHPASSQT